MHDAADSATRLAEQRQDLRVRVTTVEDDRLAQAPRQREEAAQHALLRLGGERLG